MSLEIITRPSRPETLAHDNSRLLTALATEDFLADYSEFYVPKPPELDIITACSDGRNPTGGSAALINNNPRYSKTLSINEAYARFWGGKRGIAANGGIDGVSDDIGIETNMRIMGHSDEYSEGSRIFLREDDSQELGCALHRRVGAGIVSLTEPGLVRRVALAEEQRTTGRADRMEVVLSRGFSAVRSTFSDLTRGRPSTFNVPRQALRQDVQAGGGAMILEGNHAEGAAIYNYHRGCISNTTKANKAGRSFFGIDVPTVGDEIGTYVIEHEMFYWEDFDLAARALTVAVRAALDPDSDPRNIRIGSVGNPENAVDYLNDRYGN